MKKALLSFFNIINIVLYFIVIALWLSISDERVLVMSVTVLTLIMTVVLLVIQRDKFKHYYMSHHFKMLTSTLVTAFLFFSILGVVNYLAFKNPLKKDFTGYQVNSLTEQTVKVTKSLDEKLSVKVFSKRDQFANIRTLIELYRQENANVQVEYIDASLRPDLVSSEQIFELPAIVLEYKNKKEKISRLRELEFTNALIKLSRESLPVIYYIRDHQGPSINEKNPTDLSFLKQLLIHSSYELKELDLLSAKEIPSDATIVMIWGPKSGFLKEEIEVLDQYLKKGKSLIVGLDPTLNEDVFRNLRDLLITWGVRIHNNLVVDPKSNVRGSNGLAPIVKKFGKHPISEDYNGQVFFPVVSSVEYADSPFHKGVLKNLALSSDESWGETNFQELKENQVTYTPDQDRNGPLSFAGAWEQSDGRARIVAFGNSTFVTNQYQKMVQNYIFLNSALDWLSGDDLISAFDRPQLKEEPVFISGPQVGIIFYFSVVALPVVFLITSIVFYRRRRVL